MSETVLERHYRDRVQSVRQLADGDGEQVARSLHDYEDLVALCAELAVSGRELLEKEPAACFRKPALLSPGFASGGGPSRN
jgi:hypothetical protein